MTISDFDRPALRQFIEDLGPATGELIDQFIVDIRARVDDLANLAAEPDLASLAIHAHSLKGLSRTCGLIGISDAAHELELACKDDERDRAIVHFATISENIEPAIDALTEFVGKQ